MKLTKRVVEPEENEEEEGEKPDDDHNNKPSIIIKIITIKYIKVFCIFYKMNLPQRTNYIKGPFHSFVELLLRCVKILVQYFQSLKTKPPLPIPAIKEETKYEKSCKRYADFYSKKTDDENSNIDPVLYDFDKRKELFANPDNEHEKMWKSRILIENTPRGNVMVYYNPYTLSFQYYSDEQIIPYKIMQQVAMKYVVMYRCKDFYIDMENRGDNKILAVLQKEEDSLKSKKMKVNDITKCVNVHSETKDVFAALKDYRTDAHRTDANRSDANRSGKSTPSVPASSLIKKPEADAKFSNKFVRIGKMCEFNIAQKPSDKKIEAANDLMFGEIPVNKVIDFFDDDLEIVEHPADEPMSAYKIFKAQQMMAKLKTA
jgi:hypothetical protein